LAPKRGWKVSSDRKEMIKIGEKDGTGGGEYNFGAKERKAKKR